MACSDLCKCDECHNTEANCSHKLQNMPTGNTLMKNDISNQTTSVVTKASFAEGSNENAVNEKKVH